MDSGVVLFFSHAKRTILDFCALFEKTFGSALTEDKPVHSNRARRVPRELERTLKGVSRSVFPAGASCSGITAQSRARPD